MPQIKICGIKAPQMLEITINAGADMVGFVYFEKSPRHVDIAEIKNLISIASNKIKTVILTVNPSDEMLEKMTCLGADYLQLHGNESLERVREIKQKYNIKIIKALGIGNKDDIIKVQNFYDIVDLIILDAKPKKDAPRPGGLGKIFDWDLLKQLDDKIDYMLSGGLDEINVTNAISSVKPFGLDVSSGVEISSGIKDKDKIIKFIENAKLAAKRFN